MTEFTAFGKPVHSGDYIVHHDKDFVITEVGKHPTSDKYTALKIQSDGNSRWISVPK